MWGAFVCALLFTLEACHSGSSSSVLPSQSMGSQSDGSRTGSASFQVNVQAGTHNAAQSVVVTLVQVNGATPAVKTPPVTMNLRDSTPGCALANGALACTAKADAPAGIDTFTVAIYSGPNATGSQLSSSKATAIIDAAGNTTCAPTRNDSATLRGTP